MDYSIIFNLNVCSKKHIKKRLTCFVSRFYFMFRLYFYQKAIIYFLRKTFICATIIIIALISFYACFLSCFTVKFIEVLSQLFLATKPLIPLKIELAILYIRLSLVRLNKLLLPKLLSLTTPKILISPTFNNFLFTPRPGNNRV